MPFPRFGGTKCRTRVFHGEPEVVSVWFGVDEFQSFVPRFVVGRTLVESTERVAPAGSNLSMKCGDFGLLP